MDYVVVWKFSNLQSSMSIFWVAFLTALATVQTLAFLVTWADVEEGEARHYQCRLVELQMVWRVLVYSLSLSGYVAACPDVVGSPPSGCVGGSVSEGVEDRASEVLASWAGGGVRRWWSTEF